MDAKFLREEAARFRGMAETHDREASRQRLLAMAANYESRAEAANESAKAHSAEATGPKAVRKFANNEAV